MLRHPTATRLEALGFHGMAGAFDEQTADPAIADLGFEDRFALLVDRESAWRDTKRLQARLRHTKLRVQAAVEDIDFGPCGASIVPSSCNWPKADGSPNTST